MSIFSNFDGSASRRNIRSGREAGRGIYNQAGETYGQQYQTAQGRLEPFAQSGQQANKLYGNFLGLNGQQEQQGAFSGYQEGPYANFDRDRITQANARSMNARGYGGSGVEAMASARALQQYGQQGMDRYLDRLGGMQGQGLQTANSLASLDTGYGTQMGGLANQRANLETQAASALASTQSMGMQNALGLGSLALGAFVPGAAGISAAGNIGKTLSGFGGGVNSLFSGGTPDQYMNGSGPAYGSYRAAQGY